MTRWFLRSNRIKDDGELGVISSSITEKDTSARSQTESSSSFLSGLIFYCPVRQKGSSSTRQSFVFDPRATFTQRWNMLFFIINLFSIFIDPLFLLLPHVRQEICVQLSAPLKLNLTVIRSAIDSFYMIHILLQFVTAYVDPSSRVTGRGELVKDHDKIAWRYLRYGFWWDLSAAVPLPQVLIWFIIPYRLGGSMTWNFRTYMMLIITVQILHRSYLAYLLSVQLAMTSGIMTEKAWVIAANNLVFYLLASIVAGNWWYLLSVQRQEACWRSACDQEGSACQYAYFDCITVGTPSRDSWFRGSSVAIYCDPNNNYYEYGIYSFTVTESISSGRFFNKFFYCLWWGIRNLSSQGQNLYPSIFVLENIFAIVTGTLGLILFFFLIGNMQKYFQSATSRLEEWRMKQTDLEQWMHHRQLPKELTQSIRRYHNFEWKATQGVDEQIILNQLPANLRRQTKSYLCLNLLRQVPLFHQLDDRTLDAICERLKPALYPEGMYTIHEGYPVTEMLFIIRGHLYSYTTDGGRTGFFNSSKLSPNDFCGEELLNWALECGPHQHHHHMILPLSTRTIKTISNVEGFTLGVEDLRFISLQFRRIHSRDLHHKLRFYSQQWRTWAACFIQASWRVYNKRKKGFSADEQVLNANNEQQNSLSNFPNTCYEDMNMFVPRPDAGIEVYAARLMADVRRSASNRFELN